MQEESAAKKRKIHGSSGETGEVQALRKEGVIRTDHLLELEASDFEAVSMPLLMKTRLRKYRVRNVRPETAQAQDAQEMPARPDDEREELRNYVLGELLGEGSYGSVYKALDTRTRNQVAIKKIGGCLQLAPGGCQPSSL